MDTNITNEVNDAILNCLEDARNLEAGSESWKREMDAVVSLLKTTNEDYRNKEEAYDRSVRTENDVVSSKKELEIKEFQAESEAESKKKVSPDLKWKLAGTGALIVGERVLEAKGHLIPRFWSKLWPKFKD